MTPKDMMVIDANTEALGNPRSSLMENAGRCLAQRISEILETGKVAIFAGTGGNGGDGFVAARYLLNEGFDVDVYLLAHPSRIKSPESRFNWEVIEKIKGSLNRLKISVVEDSSNLEVTAADLVVDALLGTGVEGKIREPISSAIDVINNSKGIKVAVDVPSGLDPLTGKVFDKAVQADTTITFHRVKSGFKDAKGEYMGSIHVCDIGIPPEVEMFTGPGDLLRLKKRISSSHKGQNGGVLVIGGSRDYSGAPAIAALSSLKSGVDLAIVASPGSVSFPIRSYSPDLIVKSLSDDFITPKDADKILELARNVDSLVIGCGMGREDETGVALESLLEKIRKPLIIDADALRLIDIDLIEKLENEIVLTPHSAEFKAVFGLNIPGKLEDKVEMVLRASESSGPTILLKGPVDVIAGQGKIRLNSTGNPGMTVGGTGDCLAGLVGGLMAQGHDGYEAAFLAAYINGSAGDLAAGEYGYSFTATDLLKFIPKVFKMNGNKV
jgi:hydroxyethylthiazole kinase-like uncharacterized protein yjeF